MYAIFSSTKNKPIIRKICVEKSELEASIENIKKEDEQSHISAEKYWYVLLAPINDGWAKKVREDI